MLFLMAYGSIVRVYAPVGEVLRLPLKEVDVVGFSPRGEWTDVYVEDGDANTLLFLGYRVETVVEDVDEHVRRVVSSYRSTSQVFADLENYAQSYPSITKLDTLGFSYENRPILLLRITDNPDVDEGEPAVLITGLHHAREWPTVEITMFFIDTLLRGYSHDPEITDFVNNLDIYVIPLVNPDGYYYSRDMGNTMWRKNRRYLPEFGVYGVDLNRNYMGAVNGDPGGAHCTITAGTAVSPSSDVYCGPFPFSEAETHAVKRFVENNRNLVAVINYHTYSGVILYPWGYTSYPAPDSAYLHALADSMASQMVTENGNPYEAMQAPDIGYTATGDSDDWEYGYSIHVSGYPMIAFTPEACESFQPDPSLLDQIVREHWKGIKAIFRNAPNIRSHVKPFVIVDSLIVEDTVPTTFQVDIAVRGPYASPTRYSLRYFTSYGWKTDSAEGGLSLWDYNGFYVSATRSHSGTYSFRAIYQNGKVYHMTTKYPYLVMPGDSLTFWTWYSIEDNYDAAFVEVSEDGNLFVPLDMFTGSSAGWVRKSYPLDAWVGKWVYFRFRFTTDAFVTEDGFYVDDISPVPLLGGETLISDSITSLPYTVSLPNGEYYLQGRGYNVKGWGSWSSPRKVVVSSLVSLEEKKENSRKSDVAYYSVDGRFLGGTPPKAKGVYFERRGDTFRKVLIR